MRGLKGGVGISRKGIDNITGKIADGDRWTVSVKGVNGIEWDKRNDEDCESWTGKIDRLVMNGGCKTI